GDFVAIFTLKNELICIGEAEMTSEEILEKEKGVAVRTSKVFMERGIYSL
ncbi:MAG: PUA domain-containing protein, partial [Patescibacteria group bacterium]